MSQAERIRCLNQSRFSQQEARSGGRMVAYWMHAAVRTRFNHALEYAIHLANHRRSPLHVFFVITPGYPYATRRHYRFLIEGLQAVRRNLTARGIPFFLYEGDPVKEALRISSQASTLITDRGYPRIQQKWYDEIAKQSSCPLVQVETNVVVPVEVASSKEEYSAATFRPRILRHRDTFLQRIENQAYWNAHNEAAPKAHYPSPDTLVNTSGAGTSDTVSALSGGEDAAAGHLAEFLTERFAEYGESRNIPDRDLTSGMSPYLHFGHISPVEIALSAIEYGDAVLAPEQRGSLDTFLEELIVRRELAVNFTHYNTAYDSFASLPEWARKTLHEHSTDARSRVYTARELEAGETEDPYWNAAQQQMIQRGLMHGYMRMYWGKKILEWTTDPEDAYHLALEMNDRYELDGRDPNGYAGVAWCFGKHDRPWTERPIFGKVRYMNDRGLKRKFKQIDQYVTRWCG